MTTARPDAASAYRSHAAKRLAQYLRTELERTDGALYVNGDRLAEELREPSKDLERQLRELSGSTPGLTFSLESARPRSVWRISRPD